MLLSGKRLLHLGAGEFSLPAIQAAKDLGCFVVVTDNVPSNPGHALADFSAGASTVDFDACVEVALEHRVDGVMTYGSDVSTPAVAYVAEVLGLPGNPPASAKILQRKDLIRSFQRQQGLNHPDFVVLTPEANGAVPVSERVRGFAFPGVVKPVDSSGSKGISLVHGPDEVPAAAARALAFSRVGLALLEQYLAPDMLELDGDVWFRRGELAFRHYGHNYFSKQHATMVPVGEIFPGFFGDDVGAALDVQFEELIRGLGLRDGCLNFDGVVSQGQVYLLDIALRNGGNLVPRLIHLSTGFNLTQAAVCTALGVDYPCDATIPLQARPVASYVLSAAVAGQFDRVELAPEAQEHLVELRLFVQPGAQVLPFTRGDRALGMAIFQFPDMQLMRRIMDRIEDLVSVQVSTRTP